MKKIAIIGAGQLGSRHLQGLMKGRSEMEVWVIDQSKEALLVAKERCEQVEQATIKKVHYLESIEFLPDNLDLVIVATGSKPRAQIIKSLLAHSKVMYMVLEKFLFTRLKDFDDIAFLLNRKNVRCWVDCTRRLFDCYQELCRFINQDQPVEMEYRGQNWGMCCNTVHFIDLWMFLAGDCTFEVDLSKVEPRIQESKRKGYIELLGVERFESENGDILTLASLDKYDGKSVIIIKNAGREIIMDEVNGLWSCNGETHPARLYRQSDITGSLVDEILLTGKSHLVSFANSVEYHKPYLKAVIEFVNRIQGSSTDSCSIT